MKKGTKIILIIILCYILIGFLLGLILTGRPVGIQTLETCTSPSINCLFENGNCLEDNSTKITEITCNNYKFRDPIFFTEIFNLYKSCHAKEILIYEGNTEIGTREDLSNCRYKMNFFKLD